MRPVRDEYRLPVDVDVLAIYPHAHYLARTVSSVARLPDGTTRALIRIDDWDFNWQDEYRYAEPVRLPAGSRVFMRYVYDNSAHNRRNPNRVPRRVRFGPRATDEMAELMMQVRPVDAGDAAILRQDVAGKVAQIVVGGAEARLAEDPASPALHEELAVRLATAGRVDQSIEHLKQAIRLDPNRATAHYNLATALVRRGEIGAAIARYRQVLALDPNHAGAHNNLGGLLQSIGRHAEAAQQYRRAVRIDPNHAGAQYNLANILLAESRFGEAEATLRQALAVRPVDPDVHASLGHALVGQGRIDAGVAEYREALRLAPTGRRSIATWVTRSGLRADSRRLAGRWRSRASSKPGSGDGALRQLGLRERRTARFAALVAPQIPRHPRDDIVESRPFCGRHHITLHGRRLRVFP